MKRSAIARFLGAMGYLLHPESFQAMAMLALLLGLLEWVARIPGSIYFLGYPASRLAWGAYFLVVAHKAAQGTRLLPVWADLMDIWEGVILPLARGALATAWCWTCLAAYAGMEVGLSRFMEQYHGDPLALLMDHSPWGLALLAAGLFCLPAALNAALTSRALLGQLNPMLGWRLASRVPAAFAGAFVTLQLLGLAGQGAGILSNLFQVALPIPLASPVIAQFLRLWVPLAQARTLGEFVNEYREEMLGAPPDQG